jgi:hypothetical protein
MREFDGCLQLLFQDRLEKSWRQGVCAAADEHLVGAAQCDPLPGPTVLFQSPGHLGCRNRPGAAGQRRRTDRHGRQVGLGQVWDQIPQGDLGPVHLGLGWQDDFQRRPGRNRQTGQKQEAGSRRQEAAGEKAPEP